MKKLLKVFRICLTLLFVISFISIYSFAENTNDFEVNFSKFKFTTQDYNNKDVCVDFENNVDEEIAFIKDKNSGEVLEKITLISKNIMFRSSDNVHPYTFIREKTFGGTSVVLEVNVEVYSNGSFRQINSLQGSYLSIGSQITSTSLEYKNVNVWNPNNSYPTYKLLYAYNGTLVAEVESGFNGGIEAKLLDAGFNFGSSINFKKYYRLVFNSSGTLSVY